MNLNLPDRLQHDLAGWAQAAYPEEACGLMIGERADGICHVREVRLARNREADRPNDRFDLDPADYLAAERAALDAGLDVVGIWHTHPDHPAEPSATDLAAAWAGWSYLILSVSGAGVRDVRAWQLAGDRFVEEAIRDEP